jgi:hypothetical protein
MTDAAEVCWQNLFLKKRYVHSFLFGLVSTSSLSSEAVDVGGGGTIDGTDVDGVGAGTTAGAFAPLVVPPSAKRYQ